MTGEHKGKEQNPPLASVDTEGLSVTSQTQSLVNVMWFLEGNKELSLGLEVGVAIPTSQTDGSEQFDLWRYPRIPGTCLKP